MQAEIPIFVFCVLVHAGIYLSADRRDRRLRLMLGMALLFLTPSLWYLGTILEVAEQQPARWLGVALRLAPFYMPPASFAIYGIKRNFS